MEVDIIARTIFQIARDKHCDHPIAPPVDLDDIHIVNERQDQELQELREKFNEAGDIVIDDFPEIIDGGSF